MRPYDAIRIASESVTSVFGENLGVETVRAGKGAACHITLPVRNPGNPAASLRELFARYFRLESDIELPAGWSVMDVDAWTCPACRRQHHAGVAFCTTCGTARPPRRSTFVRRWRMWSIVLAISILSIAGFGWCVNVLVSGVSEVSDIGPWPGEDSSAVDLLHLDLTADGLSPSVMDQVPPAARQSGQVDGAFLSLQRGTDFAGEVLLVRYADEDDARLSFDGYVASASAPPPCRTSLTSSFGNRAVFRCTMSAGQQRVYRHGVWLLVIFAPDSSEAGAGDRVEYIRDSIARHWKTLQLQ